MFHAHFQSAIRFKSLWEDQGPAEAYQPTPAEKVRHFQREGRDSADKNAGRSERPAQLARVSPIDKAILHCTLIAA